jgi:hypothetical protein
MGRLTEYEVYLDKYVEQTGRIVVTAATPKQAIELALARACQDDVEWNTRRGPRYEVGEVLEQT